MTQSAPHNAPTQRNRLLVLSYHFPPDGAIGGWRWAGISKYLARTGWEVHVVTAAGQGGEMVQPGLHVHHVPPRRTTNDLYMAWVRRHRTRSSTPELSSIQDPGDTADHPSKPGWLRRNLSEALVFPDWGRGWLLRAASTSRRLLRTHRFCAVVTSGPPHSTHLAGLLSCRGRPEALLVDMRDPWVTTLVGSDGTLPRAVNSGLFGSLRTALEGRVFGRARMVITNTSPFAELLRARHPALPIAFIPNGVDMERIRRAPVGTFEEFSMVYAGTLYYRRNLTPVLRALQLLLEEDASARAGIRLRVAGQMDDAHARQFAHEVTVMNLSGTVINLGEISSGAAMELVCRSHLALVLAQHQPLQVPAKLYECVALGIPTLVIAEDGSAAAEEARRIGAEARGPGDVAGIREVIARARAGGSWSRARAAIGYDAVARNFERVLRGL